MVTFCRDHCNGIVLFVIIALLSCNCTAKCKNYQTELRAFLNLRLLIIIVAIQSPLYFAVSVQIVREHNKHE